MKCRLREKYLSLRIKILIRMLFGLNGLMNLKTEIGEILSTVPLFIALYSFFRRRNMINSLLITFVIYKRHFIRLSITSQIHLITNNNLMTHQFLTDSVFSKIVIFLIISHLSYIYRLPISM